jgi:cellulose synthase/poly-beta-1,6-N-acetylglucosamine synthase-like glycosyltransferase
VAALDHNFESLSPRLQPRAVPLASRAINLGAMALFLTLIGQAFVQQGIGAWSVGIVYIVYDSCLLAFTAWHIRSLGSGGQAPALAVPRPTLTAIVAAHDEAAVLGVTIDRLAAQDDPADMILLADDGSTDASAEVLHRLYGPDQPAWGELSGPAPRLQSLSWLRLRHGGKARALNRAIERAWTEIIVTVDADTLLAPGALRAMRDAFAAEQGLVAATGVPVPVCGPDRMGRFFQWFQRYEYVRNFLSRFAWMRLDSLLLISGAFAAFRRDAVVEVGGFDASCMVEDYELIHRLHRYSVDNGRDWRVRVVEGAQAITDVPAAPLAFLRQRRRWFGGFLQTQYWNRDMVGNRTYGYLGTAMLPVKALDAFQPVYGLAALGLLVGFVVTGNCSIALPIFAIMILKIVVDLTFHLWSIGRYRAWTGQTNGLHLGQAILASVLEPFCFQPLRHAGACWGWIAFLTGRETWHRQHRTAIMEMARR